MAQADTIVPGGVQGLDRYAYVNNSPLNYVDPSGHFGQCKDGQSGYQCRMTQQRAAQLYSGWDMAKAAQQHAYNARRCDHNSSCNGQSDTTAWLLAQARANAISCARNLLCRNDGMVINTPEPTAQTPAPTLVPSNPSNPGSSSWTDYLRLPDYGAFQVGAGPFGWPGGGAISVTWSYGHIYIGAGGNFGKSSGLLLYGIPMSANLSGGWLLQLDKPTPEQMHSFLTGVAINVSGGYIVGVGGTWGNVGKTSPSDFAVEGGLYSPQIGVSVTYTVLEIDTNSGNVAWLP